MGLILDEIRAKKHTMGYHNAKMGSINSQIQENPVKGAQDAKDNREERMMIAGADKWVSKQLNC